MAWLVLVVTTLVAAAMMVGWSWFIEARVGLHPSGTVAGPWTDPQDEVTYRVQSITPTQTVTTYSGQEKAPPGLSYVLVTYTVEGDVKPTSGCLMTLIGAGSDSWEPASVGVTGPGSEGSCDQGRPGKPVLILLTYQVPTSRVAQLRGVQVNTPMSLNQPPILVAG